MTSRKRKKGDKPQRGAPLRGYAIWSGLVFQMGAMVFAGLMGGRLYNQMVADAGRMAEMVGVLLGVIAAVTFAVRSVIRIHQRNKP